MSNIISSDFYRVRRGGALLYTFIALLAVVVLIVITIAVSQSDSYNQMMTDAAAGMSETEQAELQQDLTEARQENSGLANGAAVGKQMFSQLVVILCFLPIALSVFCADFSAGTYRNTLSYESNRTRVYFSKLLLSVVLCIAMVIGMLLFSWLLGSVVFGAGGFSLAYFGQILTTFLLQLPIYLAVIAVCHFLVAFTRKSSITIAVFLVGIIAVAIAAQSIAGSFPGLEWLVMLEPQTGMQMMANYSAFATGEILFVVAYNLGIAVVATLLGVLHFRKADMP